jgi:hypothetical protein
MRLASSIVALIGMCACGPAPGYEPLAPPDAPSRDTGERDREPAAAAEVSLVHHEQEAACARAARWSRRAAELADQGWVARPRRLLRHAARTCPTAADQALADRLPKANSAKSRAGLEREMAVADAALQRRRGAEWVAAASRQLGVTPRLITRPAGVVVGMTPNASRVLLVSEPSADPRKPVITVLDGANGLPLHRLQLDDYVRGADVVGDHLLVVHQSKLVVHSLVSAKPPQELSWTAERYKWARFIDGGKAVVAGGEASFAGFVRVFDVATGDSRGSLPFKERGDYEVMAPIDGDRLLTASADELLVVDYRRFAITRRVAIWPDPDKRAAWMKAVAVTPTGKLAALDWDGVLRIWDTTGDTPIQSIETKERDGSLIFLEGGSRIALAGGFGFRGELKTFEVASGKAVRSRPLNGAMSVLSRDGTRVVVGARDRPPQLEDLAGKALWAYPPGPSTIESFALSEGLVIGRETRHGSDSEVELLAWYRGQEHRLVRAGYKADVLAIAPSGRRVAAVTGSDGVLWELDRDEAIALPIPGASGFPDRMRFAGDNRLRLMFEREATTHVTDAPFTSWRSSRAIEGLDGFRGTALSIHGDAMAIDDGRITLLPDRVLVERGGGGMAFSGDGRLAYVGDPDGLSWFDRQGARIGKLPLGCVPAKIAADEKGDLVVAHCGRELVALVPPATVITRSEDASSPEAMHVAGDLVALVDRSRVRLLDPRLRDRATLEVRAGHLFVTASTGEVWYPSREGHRPEFRGQLACLLGDRAYPWSWCEDSLVDDTLVDRLLRP